MIRMVLSLYVRSAGLICRINKLTFYRYKKMNKTILIIIDGLRPDALVQADTPSIYNMIKNGSHTFNAQTVTPSITLPVHFSTFTSMVPIDHGVITNTGSPQPSSTSRGIIDVAKDCGKKTASFYSWENLRYLSEPGSLDHAFFINSYSRDNLDLNIAQAASGYLKLCQPDFCFIYLEAVDIAGHEYGFMSDEYISTIESADMAVGFILNNADQYNIILHSDHGGIGYHHLEKVPEVMTIPWVAYGPKIKQGYTITDTVSVIDTAPTLADLMGIPLHRSWCGKSISECLKNS